MEIVQDKWLTIKELAGYLKVSRDLLYKWAQAGKIPVSKVGNQWRFDREEIDEWVKSQRSRQLGSGLAIMHRRLLCAWPVPDGNRTSVHI
jgi:excisionase family DNA binding protein